jgi:hypothetical protein
MHPTLNPCSGLWVVHYTCITHSHIYVGLLLYWSSKCLRQTPHETRPYYRTPPSPHTALVHGRSRTCKIKRLTLPRIVVPGVVRRGLNATHSPPSGLGDDFSRRSVVWVRVPYLTTLFRHEARGTWRVCYRTHTRALEPCSTGMLVLVRDQTRCRERFTQDAGAVKRVIP